MEIENKQKYTIQFKLLLDGINCRDTELEIPLDKIETIDKKFENTEGLKIIQCDPSPKANIKFKILGGTENFGETIEVQGQFKSDKGYKDLSDSEIFEKTYHYPFIFRLLGVGAVYLYSIEIEPYNTIDYKKAIKFPLNYAKMIKDRRLFEITKEDTPKIKAFFKVLWNPIIQGFLPMSEIAKPIQVALDMYNNAFLNTGLFEARVRADQSQIAFLISALEALYLPKPVNKSITRTIKERASRILESFDYDCLQVRKKIGKAYDIRSLYFHGSFRKNKLKTWEDVKRDIDNFTQELFENVRLSLLTFLGLSIINKRQKIATFSSRDF